MSPRTTPTMADEPPARPSIPSVRLVPFEQATITNVIIITYIPHFVYHPHSPLNGVSHA